MVEPRFHPRDLGLAAAAALVCLLVGWSLYRQGIDLGSDGSWLLGTSRLLDGARLYRDFEPGDGPLRYWILAPFLSVVDKASALALLRGLGLALFAGGGLFWLLRRGLGWSAGLWPLGLLALGPVDPPLAIALLALAVAAGRWRHSAVALGALLVCAAFADLRAFVALLPLAAAAHFARTKEERGGAGALFFGAVLMVALTAFAIAFSGEASVALRNSFVHPLYRLVEHFGNGGVLRWWATLDHGAWVQLPFADLPTGEALGDLGATHRFAHRWAYRGLVMLLPILAISFAWQLRGEHRERAIAAGGGAAAFWWIFANGDAPSSEQAALLALATLLLCSPALRRRSSAPRFLHLAYLLLLLPLALESLGLATRSGRPELRLFERGGVFLSDERAGRLDEFFSRIQPALSSPIVIWPDQAGLYYLYDAEPAVPQLGLEGLDLPENARRDDLLAADPQVVLLAQSWNSSAQAFRERDEGLWTALREHYRVAGWLRGRTDRLRLLVHMQADQTLQTLPLPQRLPQIELTVSNDFSPALRRNLTVGQSFRTGETDLAGVLFKWKTQGSKLAFDCKIRVWEKLGNEFDSLLSSTVVRVEVPGDGARTFLRLEIPETAHKELAVTLELLDDLSDEVRLHWHRHDASGREVDLFDEGDALLDLHEADADLYFVAY